MSPKYTQADLDRWIHDAENVGGGPNHAEAPARIPKPIKPKGEDKPEPKVKTPRPKIEEDDDEG